jgi:hypothetical protein
MSLAIASGMIFLVCLMMFVLGLVSESRTSDRKAQRPGRSMHKRLQKLRQSQK